MYPSSETTFPRMPLCVHSKSLETTEDLVNFLIMWAVASHCGIPFLNLKSINNELFSITKADFQPQNVGELLQAVCDGAEADYEKLMNSLKGSP